MSTARVIALFSALTAAACTTALPPEKTPALGIPFNEEAKQGYLHLATAEYDDFDVFGWKHFRDKAERSMLGDIVWPERNGDHELPPAALDEAYALREELVAVLEAGGRVLAPADAAVAQVNFDCWLAELAENPQSAQAQACKEAFLAALDQTRAALGPSEPFAVFFDTGSAELDRGAMAVIRQAARTADLVGPARIDVVGYADPTGSAQYAIAISQERAEAVAAALADLGVPRERINVQARGETRLSPIDAENRRVEITFAG